MDIKQFKALLDSYEEAGLNLGESYFLIKYNQAERHHEELMAALEKLDKPQIIIRDAGARLSD